MGWFSRTARGKVKHVTPNEVTLQDASGVFRHYDFWYAGTPKLNSLLSEGDFVELVYVNDFGRPKFISMKVHK